MSRQRDSKTDLVEIGRRRKRNLRRGQQRRAITTKLTEADLLNIERTQKRRSDRPAALTLREIHVADKVFQWRNREENIAQSVNHRKELVRVLTSTKRALDPIVVTPIGDKFFLLEGHHRIEAYYEVGWKKGVPVRYYLGNVKEAQDEALLLNIKDKSQMTRAEKFDAAFRLVKGESKTYEQIKHATTVSIRTINTMAKVLREVPETIKENSWRRAQRAHQQHLDPLSDASQVDDWAEKRAQKLAKQLIHNVGTGFVKDPDITARALEIISEDLPRALIYEWLDTAEDVLVEVVREENNEEAEELLLAFIYRHRAEDRSPAGEDEGL